MPKQRISIAKYNEITEVYADLQSTAKTARKCGVSENTVRKYLTKGDPDRGLAPINAILTEAGKRTAEAMADKISARDNKILEMVDKAIDDILDGKVATPRYTDVETLLDLADRIEAKRTASKDDGKIVVEFYDPDADG